MTADCGSIIVNPRSLAKLQKILPVSVLQVESFSFPPLLFIRFIHFLLFLLLLFLLLLLFIHFLLFLLLVQDASFSQQPGGARRMVVPAGSGHLARQAVTGGIKSRLGGEGGVMARLGGEGGLAGRLGEQGGGREQEMDWDPEADRYVIKKGELCKPSSSKSSSSHA